MVRGLLVLCIVIVGGVCNGAASRSFASLGDFAQAIVDGQPDAPQTAWLFCGDFLSVDQQGAQVAVSPSSPSDDSRASSPEGSSDGSRERKKRLFRSKPYSLKKIGKSKWKCPFCTYMSVVNSNVHRHIRQRHSGILNALERKVATHE